MSQQKIGCGYSLEVPRRGASKEYPQHMFSWRNKKTIYRISPLIWSYEYESISLSGDLLQIVTQKTDANNAFQEITDQLSWAESHFKNLRNPREIVTEFVFRRLNFEIALSETHFVLKLILFVHTPIQSNLIWSSSIMIDVHVSGHERGIKDRHETP